MKKVASRASTEEREIQIDPLDTSVPTTLLYGRVASRLCGSTDLRSSRQYV
jgi:hypothetical protein